MQNHIEQTIEQVTGSRPRRLSSFGGGGIADVYKVDLENGSAIVAKTSEAGNSLSLEARMLQYLRASTALPVPTVLFDDSRLLLMSLLPTSGSLGETGNVEAADLIASLHTITDDYFGFDYDTVIGGLHQPNPRNARWLPFFAEHRLIHMGQQAMKAGQLPVSMMARLEKFCERLDTWLEEPDHPALIHGDLWGGNVLTDRGHISGFIDPALYFADPEIELAFSTLFNTFSQAFFDRYREHRPIKPGFFEERRDIYNIYPLLVHVCLFGGSYVTSVERTLSKFGV